MTTPHAAASVQQHGTQAVDGRRRAVIENVQPSVDGGRFAIKRVVGEAVVVEADAFADGHDAVRVVVRYRSPNNDSREVEMVALGNDRWRASFEVTELGLWRFEVYAWVDHWLTWRRELARREEPADILIALTVGAGLLDEAAARAEGADAQRLVQLANQLRGAVDAESGKALALALELHELAARYPDRRLQSLEGPFEVRVDPVRARFSSWYEFFPRSTASEPGKHGTFKDALAWVDYAADLGFDVVYLPPIHPIGRIKRKGPNNALQAGPDDGGSPWAIGAQEGGHKDIHPALGTPEDFRQLLAHARTRGVEVAIDIAFQCAPDHPYVRSHPQWFRKRPDGSIQYAENPPKKYQDIYPFDFETEDWQALYAELTDIVMHWVREGVRVFRVDNPHTKPFPLWERLIGEVKAAAPDCIFLSEAFTRPKVMHRLAKLGFTQSYTYFPWRNTKHELTAYFTELCLGPGREYFRPNTWPNTPDILTEYLQIGGRAAFMTRLVLAATLSASYGIYGPAFELMEHEPREPGSEEYRNSEKYQIRHWDLNRPDSLAPFIARVNKIRREHAALQSDWSLRFLNIDNEQMIAYMKSATVGGDQDQIIVVANLDPWHAQSGWLELPLADLGLTPDRPYRVQDLLAGGSFLWHGARNFVRLDPQGVVAHIFHLRRRVRTERDFDYFM
jgi:starch synthase (maltosyl-transferring)